MTVPADEICLTNANSKSIINLAALADNKLTAKSKDVKNVSSSELVYVFCRSMMFLVKMAVPIFFIPFENGCLLWQVLTEKLTIIADICRSCSFLRYLALLDAPASV